MYIRCIYIYIYICVHVYASKTYMQHCQEEDLLFILIRVSAVECMQLNCRYTFSSPKSHSSDRKIGDGDSPRRIP